MKNKFLQQQFNTFLRKEMPVKDNKLKTNNFIINKNFAYQQ